jgi:hypothetical protein
MADTVGYISLIGDRVPDIGKGGETNGLVATLVCDAHLIF